MDISSRKEVKQQSQDFTSADRLGSDQFDLVYGRKLKSPVLGHHYQLPDLPTNYLPPTILDTSLLHIPVYAHLKVYDLEPVRLPEMPSILSSLCNDVMQSSENTVRSKSSKVSTARMSEEDKISASHSVHGGAKSAHKK
ncbi:WD repeat-containing protein on Y chromosome [Pseudomyrmex gracilis]|uniref:WD repeat-containing protein on Y chromosome n=1 Tax=Pseudomyrmex gracilis TaxID=219809 RepID=UPI000994A71C|nr:WD repeat-containing protein on Y chromosome [Pseudomyrmex gracilis]XP_020285204.1 WD repeat-containing protein on Y chromosome [Pseudomyrmex gracilis]XP_020285205.1 WD repeat-containing protein on Y chromosome [Pseudomyrmex gracilis]